MFSDCPQMSKELINFYDAAYIKAVDVTGSPSKDAAIGVLGAFHTTVCVILSPMLYVCVKTKKYTL